jgi:hypothetical protein
MSTEASRLLDLLKRYFHIFGDKTACYEDVRQYTDLDSDFVVRLDSIPRKG